MKTPFYCLFILFSAALVACDKPNPTPEILDPVYQDLFKLSEEAKKSLPELKAGVADAQKELDNVKPQTGQIAYATKRLREAAEKCNKAQQMTTYLEIRAESRMKYDRESYQKAWGKKLPWPDPAEYTAFKEAEEAKFTKSYWDIKGRLKAAGVTPSGTKVEKKEGEPKKEESK